MGETSTIQYLTNKQVDRRKWDQCVEGSANGLIYARSAYLDHICCHWDALVVGNYEAVMPLPWKKKYLLRYIYAPPFIQQLGIIGHTSGLDASSLISLVSKRFFLGDLFFNFANDMVQSLPVTAKTNLVIDLNRSFPELERRFTDHLRRNLKAVNEHEVNITDDVPCERIIDLFKEHYERRTPHVRSKDYGRFLKLCLELERSGNCFTRAVKSRDNQLLSAGIFLKDRKRIYHILSATTEQGRSQRTNHYLLASVIKEFAGQDLLFDFEGSDIEGVKRFYLNFGPDNQPYFYYHFEPLSFRKVFRYKLTLSLY